MPCPPIGVLRLELTDDFVLSYRYYDPTLTIVRELQIGGTGQVGHGCFATLNKFASLFHSNMQGSL